MKLTFLLSIIFAWNVSASVFSQVVHFEKKDKKISIKNVLNAIENQTEYTFFYNDAFLDLNRPVQLDQKDMEVGELLNNIFEGTNLTFKEQDNKFIVITPKATLQGISITGTITDNGEPMPGVNVVVKGSITGTVTDINGKYSINVPDRNAVLQFSFIGYTTQEITIGDQTTINVALGEDTREIEEVVVVGYGTQKKVNLTGAIETVSSDVFENRSLSNTTQALQGAIPNLNITLEDGKPSRSASFNIRGKTSISAAGGSALVLIDGVEGDPAMLNPNDIENVSVLKDAASAAIYGARGAFGVVLITTKRPQKGRTTVNYTGNYSIQSPTRTPDFVTDAVTWVEHFRMAYVNNQGTVPTSINNNMQAYSDEWLDRLRAWKASGAGPKTEVLPSGAYEYYSNTDWYDLLYKDQTFVQDHNLSVSGGNEKADFYVSGRFYDNGGLYNYNPDTYKSYNIRAKGGLQVYDWLRMTNNMEFSNSDYHSPFTASFTANVQRYIQVSAFPSMPLYNPDGSFTRGTAYTLGGFMTGNNYQDFNNKLFKNTVGFSTNFFNKTFRINGDFTVRYGTSGLFKKQVKVPYSEKKDVTAYIGNANGVITEKGTNTLYTATNIYAEYENTFAGSHYVKGMVGYGYETSSYHENYIDRNGLLIGSAESIALATGTSINPTANVKNWRIVGTYFRLNYGFKNRYLVEVNGRYDGSSKFPNDQQFGFFPSISGGWRLSEEPFWTVSKNIFSDIKFRASYGSLGNGTVDPYTYLELLEIGTSDRVLNGAKNKMTNSPKPLPAGLTWETATTTDFGLDFGMLQGKIRFSGDYYIRKTTDMFTKGPTLPETFGADSPYGNYADMTTKGWEITLSYQDHFTLAGKPFNFQVKGSLYDYRSKIDRFNNDTRLLSDYYVGQTIGDMWGYKTDGLFQSDPDPSKYSNTIFQSSNDNVWRAGDLKIVNLNGNKTDSGAERIDYGDKTADNPGDMIIIGNSEPRYQYSFSLSGDWNNFFISAFFTGVGKQDWYPGQETPFWGQYNRGYNSMPSWHLSNYWTEDNRDAYLPRYSQYNGACGWTADVRNDRYIQKVSYLRLKNLTIGYTIPNRITSIIGMQSARIYLSGENIACWSPLYKRTKDFDVLTATASKDSDLKDDYNQGAGNSYPLLKTFSLGVSLTF